MPFMFEQPERNPDIETIVRDHYVIPKICDRIFEDEALRLEERLESTSFSYLSKSIGRGEAIQDVLGNSEGLEGLKIQGSRGGIVLLVDPEPHANWSHPCWIATYDIDFGVEVARHSFPPQETANRRLVTFTALASCPPAA
jgi:hypothetical protein